MRLAPLLIALLPIGAASAATPPTPQPVEGPDVADAALSQEARTLRHRGMKAQNERDYKTAYAAYTAAWNVSKSYALAANLGFVEVKLGRYRDAAEHLSFALREAPKVDDDHDRLLVEKDLAEAKKYIATISFSVTPNDSYVMINRKEIGKASTLQTVFLDPGQIECQARYGERLSERRELKLEPGVALEIRLTIPERPSGVAASPPDHTSKSSEETAPGTKPVPDLSRRPEAAGDPNASDGRDRFTAGPRLPVILTGAGIAVAGLVVGLAEGAVASSAAKDRDNAARAMPQESPCVLAGPDKYATGCATASDADQRWQTAHNLSVAGYIAGGIAAAGSIAYYFLARPTRTSSVSITPTVAPNQAHLLLRSDF